MLLICVTLSRILEYLVEYCLMDDRSDGPGVHPAGERADGRWVQWFLASWATVVCQKRELCTHWISLYLSYSHPPSVFCEQVYTQPESGLMDDGFSKGVGNCAVIPKSGFISI